MNVSSNRIFQTHALALIKTDPTKRLRYGTPGVLKAQGEHQPLPGRKPAASVFIGLPETCNCRENSVQKLSQTRALVRKATAIATDVTAVGDTPRDAYYRPRLLDVAPVRDPWTS